MPGQKVTTIILGVLVLLFSPAVLAVLLLLFGFAVIVLCPETRMLRRVPIEGGGACTNCESYTCPIIVGLVMFGLPILLAIVGLVQRRRLRNRSILTGSTPHHS